MRRSGNRSTIPFALLGALTAAAVPAQARLLRDINPNGSSITSSGASYTVVGTTVYFAADDGRTGRELWRTDGSRFGTRLVKDIRPGRTGSISGGLVAAGGKVFFAAEDGNSGRELWVSDGTSSGTRMVKDIEPGKSGSQPVRLVGAGNKVWFVARTQRHGDELWVSDGTSSGTRLVKDIRSGSQGSSPSELTPLGSKLLFSAAPRFGQIPHLYVTSGTGSSTKIIAPAAGPRHLSPDGNVVWLGGSLNRVAGLIRTDGTTSGTVLVAPASVRSEIVRAGRTLFFAAKDLQHGTELWKSDGTAAGTVMVRDIFPGRLTNGPALSSQPQDLVATNGRVLFAARTRDHGRELWVSDGTRSGTRLHVDLRPGGRDGLPTRTGQKRNLTGIPRSSIAMWRGEAAITTRRTMLATTRVGTAHAVHALREGLGGGVDFVRFGDRVIFTAGHDDFGAEPFLLDLDKTKRGTYVTFGNGCRGTGTSIRSCMSRNANGGTLTSGVLPIRRTVAIEVRNGLVPATVVGYELFTQALPPATSRTMTATIHLADSNGQPQVAAARSTVVTVDRSIRFHRVAFARPLPIARLQRFFITLQTNAVRLPVVAVGSTSPAFARSQGSTVWRPIPAQRFAFRALCTSGANSFPKLTADGGPKFGQSYAVKLDAAAASARAVLLVGASDLFWDALPLPIDLSRIGAPGCRVLVSGQLQLASTTSVIGSASIPLRIPRNAALLSMPLYNQWLVFDAAANGLGLVASNAGRGIIGLR